MSRSGSASCYSWTVTARFIWTGIPVRWWAECFGELWAGLLSATDRRWARAGLPWSSWSAWASRGATSPLLAICLFPPKWRQRCAPFSLLQVPSLVALSYYLAYPYQSRTSPSPVYWSANHRWSFAAPEPSCRFLAGSLTTCVPCQCAPEQSAPPTSWLWFRESSFLLRRSCDRWGLAPVRGQALSSRPRTLSSVACAAFWICPFLGSVDSCEWKSARVRWLD